ncbi:MAG: tol-pal system-associated acyl-CoA thioesterase [Inquilinaceae bacterium]
MPEAVSGRMERGCHLFPVRVYYEDTDAGGIVYHASYLRFAERARTEMLRLAGIDQSVLAARTGAAFAVRHCTMDFRASARLDDLVTVRTRIVEIGGASLKAEQTIERNDTVLVALTLRLACIDRDGRPTRIPERVRVAFDRIAEIIVT